MSKQFHRRYANNVLNSSRNVQLWFQKVGICGGWKLASFLRASPDLVPLASRIRSRLRTQALPPAQLLECINHLLKAAGNPKLMSPTLAQTLCEHAAGNLRLLMNMANDLLNAALRQEREQLDEKLFFEVFALDVKPTSKGTPS